MNNQRNSDRESLSKSSAIGITQIIIGIGTIIAAVIATRFIVFILGIVLMVRGSLDIVDSFQKKNKKHFGMTVIGSISLGAGIIFLVWPQTGSSILSLILAGLFIVGGGQKLLAPIMQKQTVKRIQLVFGLISAVLGITILLIWPIGSFVILGILVGIEIMLNGMTITAARTTLQKFGDDFRHGQSN